MKFNSRFLALGSAVLFFPTSATVPAQVQLWAVRYNGALNNEDMANALAIDGGGNVYLTGQAFGPTFQPATTFVDTTATNFSRRFYRVVSP
jgi:hypothetical protein